MFSRIRFFFRQAIAGIGRSFGITLVATVTIGGSLAVLATLLVVVQNLHRVSEAVGREVELSAYFDPQNMTDDGPASVAAVERWEGVHTARYLDSKTAMDEFRRSLGRDAIVLDGLPENVLPPSIEVRLREQHWAVRDIQMFAEKLSQLPGIVDVRYGQEDIERIYSLLGFVRIACLVIGIALCLATILIVSNTIRLTVYARRDEIEILSLVGATGASIRTPFVLEGAIQGLFGGAFAAACLLSLQEMLRVSLERGLAYAYGPITLEFVPLAYVPLLFVVGIGLGVSGSLFSVGKFIRV